MECKKIFPFIEEFLQLCFSFLLFVVLFKVAKFPLLLFHKNFLLNVFIYIALLSIVYFRSRIFNTGIKALIDFIFQKTKEDVYEFIETNGFPASILASGKSKFMPVTFFLVQVKKDNEIFSFLSNTPLNLETGKLYRIKSGFFSGVLLDSKLSQ